MTMSRFVKAQPTGIGSDMDAAGRIAHALEYIADQLGELNERLARQDAAAEQAKPSGLKKRMEAERNR
jgi:hypothetical protein